MRSARPGPALSILSSGHDVADARLHREVAAALAEGLDVEVLALGDVDSAPAGTAARTWPRPAGMVARARHALTLPWRARGRVLLVLDPDLVAPALLRARTGRRALVVDVHEDYAALVRDRAWAAGPAGRAVRAGIGLVTRAVGRADLVVVADEHVPPLRVGPPGAQPPRRLVVRNLPTTHYLPAPAEPDPQPRLVYIGDVRASRGLHAMLEAVAAAPPWTCDIVGPVAPADAEAVTAWQAGSAAAARVRWHGRQPPTAAWAGAAGAWAGACLLADTPAFRDAMPSKLYEYVGAGLPVLVTPRPRMVEFVAATGAGAVVADAAEAAGVLQTWAADPDRLLRLRRNARRHGATGTDGDREYRHLARLIDALNRRDGLG